jgi:hypothetical protein
LRSSDYAVTYNGSADATVDITAASEISVAVTAGTGADAVTSTYILQLDVVDAFDFSVTPIPSDAIVKVYDQNGCAVAANTDGSFSGMFGQYAYTYTVTKYGYAAQSGLVPSTGGSLTVNLTQRLRTTSTT